MKKFLLIAFLLSGAMAFAADDLSKQATAFYSDNNYQKTMDLILQIAEDERSAQKESFSLIEDELKDSGEFGKIAEYYYDDLELIKLFISLLP